MSKHTSSSFLVEEDQLALFVERDLGVRAHRVALDVHLLGELALAHELGLVVFLLAAVGAWTRVRTAVRDRAIVLGRDIGGLVDSLVALGLTRSVLGASQPS